MTSGPRLSIVIVVYQMSRQAMNTLYSFSAAYQKGVDAGDYEVIVVENASDDLLGEAMIWEHGPNFRYYCLTPTNSSPVDAVRFGVQQAKGEYLGLVIDGARMITPRVLEYALMAFAVRPHAMVTVPGYHLGSAEQHLSADHDEAVERELIRSIAWPSDGYRLFDIAVLFRGRHQPGYLLPALESNVLFVSRNDYDSAGGIDARFTSPGGGMANLDLYKRIGDLPQTDLVVLAGEGSFHQYHGGVSTRPDEAREDLMTTFKDEYLRLRGQPYRKITKQPRLLGAITGRALPTLEQSAAEAMALLRSDSPRTRAALLTPPPGKGDPPAPPSTAGTPVPGGARS